MQTTLNLLDEAMKVQGLSDWAAKLGLSKRALYTARDRGHLSPAIAGALAEELGQDARDWIVVAALESERDSACKTRMVKRVGAILKRYFKNHRLLGRRGTP